MNIIDTGSICYFGLSVSPSVSPTFFSHDLQNIFPKIFEIFFSKIFKIFFQKFLQKFNKRWFFLHLQNLVFQTLSLIFLSISASNKPKIYYKIQSIFHCLGLFFLSPQGKYSRILETMEIEEDNCPSYLL